MQGVPEEQEELFNLSNIQQMLDVNSQTELCRLFTSESCIEILSVSCQ